MKKAHKALSILTLMVLIILGFNSCLGVNADIILNPDNSGTLNLEYRISHALESLGKQDGNEQWLPLPVGKADFERTIPRIPGMKMLSFSSKDDGKDIVISVKLEFKNMDALLEFLDASGEKAVFAREGASSRLTLVLSGGGGNKDLEDLFAKVSDGYFVNISLALPHEGSLKAPSIEGGEIQGQGKKLACRLPLSRILASKDAMKLEFTW
ncbi:hypothetical protein [Leadbettera azotonutricia]|uniref:Uncharacterized protein n=1 Tax=Leadbettera azotonutricia (strain ATCC BAA-888 / DSM 13862 / ZAS-9) TaxID=545695 RepID=F5YBK3_LEAAZ|nr:hypothetical protein [Leadbettera azotonutricia]AEF81558.1 hypothetical protein TREAZ_0574 [Leadbettera azotonutricia ZAS-9]